MIDQLLHPAHIAISTRWMIGEAWHVVNEVAGMGRGGHGGAPGALMAW